MTTLARPRDLDRTTNKEDGHRTIDQGATAPTTRLPTVSRARRQPSTNILSGSQLNGNEYAGNSTDYL